MTALLEALIAKANRRLGVKKTEALVRLHTPPRYALFPPVNDLHQPCPPEFLPADVRAAMAEALRNALAADEQP